MTIETKFLIGLLLLMGIGSFMCSFLGTDNSFTDLSTAATNLADKFDNVTYKSIGPIVFQGGSFLFSVIGFMGACIFWNFSFFDGFEWLRIMLILINFALLLKILVDFFRMLKPFGS